MKTKKNIITADELNKAIQKFLDQGGIIEKLPEQKSFESRAVGVKYNAMEIGTEVVG